ncbi:MAG: aldehyde dehydrogenase family protein [Oligoflexia bacterium]|nr:aldehyde dehydrogenase family protein [Oligoflexia bacterium]
MFKNQALTDFTIEKNRAAMRRALDDLERSLRTAPLKAFPIVEGQELTTAVSFRREDPSTESRAVALTSFAGVAEVERALVGLSRGAAAWRSTAFSRRAEIVRRAAALMRERHFELCAVINMEAGKPWREADADVAEAIDFCEFYADEMLRLGPPFKTMEIAGEENHYFYQPRGICAVISPWNFPLAIACGMAAAALVTGNCVVLKPAEQTSLTAYYLAKIFLDAGIPSNAFAFLPGWGEEVGQALVESPLVDMICFTGSKAVGLQIIRSAAQVRADQQSVKKVVAELGGKNAIIVDDDADLDEAIKGVLYSAFGFAGQKCSACSRLIVVGSAYEPFLARLKEAAADIISGPASDPATLLGPVIDRESRDRILQTIARAQARHTALFVGTPHGGGYFVPAAIFRDVAPDAEIWREEIFGPVLAACQAENFEQALKLANDSQYALTGAVFSRSPAHIEAARNGFRVGNLYINRGCTGALVGRQPFGGFKMSGVGSKAGGVDYLVQFMEPRTVTENTMRRGFAPE